MLAQLTPKQIDRLEAQRDSDDALARALAYTKQKRAEERARVLGVQISSPQFKTLFDRMTDEQARAKPNKPVQRRTTGDGARRPKNMLHEVDGISMTVRQWSDETGIAFNTLTKRLLRGLTMQEAIETPVVRGRPRGAGVGRSSPKAPGTGVGSLAREREELGFFQCPL